MSSPLPEPDEPRPGRPDDEGEAGPDERRDKPTAHSSEPLSAADVDQRFAAIVGSADMGGPAPADIVDARGIAATSHLAGEHSRPPRDDTAPHAEARNEFGPRDYTAEEPEEGFTPPDPDPIEVLEPKRLIAGLMVVIPAVIIFGALLMSRSLSSLTMLTLGASALVGMVWFVSLLPHHRDPNDPGAVV